MLCEEQQRKTINSINDKLQTLITIKQIVFGLNTRNDIESVCSIIQNIDIIYPLSNNILVSQMINTLILIKKIDCSLYLNFIKEIETFEKNNNIKSKIFKIFIQLILDQNSQGAYYLLENMIEHNIIESEIVQNKVNPYFMHHMSDEEIKKSEISVYLKQFAVKYEELSKNDWELHKKLIKEGVNPNEIATIIRNDEIEKLQEISSQSDFNFDQHIALSIYERCDFVYNWNVSLIDYAAFFSAVKCFKFLLMNNANVKNTGKYAVSGGNEESFIYVNKIIHHLKMHMKQQ